MLSEKEINDLKEKYNSLQTLNQSLREEKIRLSSEVKTLKESLDKKEKELLDSTGKESLQDVVKWYEEESRNLSEDVSKLTKELQSYLDDYDEE
jgi:FtsZ-binding cell division protein ZapB